ncbi:MAG TPA: hypothetical protein VFL47_06455 [Flavisolibacter sp.]|nr:hypothetical protein [Flavisolibacter sp.]
MKQAFLFVAAAGLIMSCTNSGSDTGRYDTAADTTKNITTNSGAAGTGGVGAGFGTGGSAGLDTNTTPGVNASTQQHHE